MQGVDRKTYAVIINEIEKKTLKPYYIFLGFNRILIEKIIDTIKSKVKTKNPKYNISTFKITDRQSFLRIEETLYIPSFWSKFTIVVLDVAAVEWMKDFSEKIAVVLKKLDIISPTQELNSTLVLWTDKYEIKIGKQNEYQPKERPFILLKASSSIASIVHDEAKRLGVSFDIGAFETLVNNIENKPEIVIRELEKISLSINPRYRIISQDIEELLSYTKESKMWEITKYLMFGDTKKLLKYSSKIVENYDHSYIIASLARTLFAMIKIKEIENKNVVIYDNEITDITGIRTEKEIESFKSFIKKVSIEKIKKFISELSNIDVLIKTSKSANHLQIFFLQYK